VCVCVCVCVGWPRQTEVGDMRKGGTGGWDGRRGRKVVRWKAREEGGGRKTAHPSQATADPVCAAGWSVPTGPEENCLH
jgi:hypothetical protein